MERVRRYKWTAGNNPIACLGTALIVIGARFWMVSHYGTSLPINDQWGGEGFYLLKPWYEGRLTFAALLAPHNEHRVFFSRLLTLTLTAGNGQWDCMLQMVFDAIFCGAIAAMLLWTW